MKSTLKVILITILSFLLILLIFISIALWFVFTPEKLTPMVRKQVAKQIICKTEIGKVEPTFFSTFPQFGLKIDHFLIINPVKGSPNDTLIYADQIVGIFDAMAWWKRDEIIIRELILRNGTLSIFYDSLENSNLSIFPPDTVTSVDTSTAAIAAVLENIRMENINFQYVDESMQLNTSLKNLSGTINGTYNSDTFSGNINLDQSDISLEYKSEKYLTNVSTSLIMKADFTYPNLWLKIKSASGKLNNIPLEINGDFGRDTLTNNLVFNLNIQADYSPVDQLIKMVPPSYSSYFKDVDAKGDLKVLCKMSGVYNDTSMPLFDIRLLMKNGIVKYNGMPLELNEINGDVTIVTDAMTDSLTFTRIDHFEAKTAQSSFSVEGLVNHLFSNIYCDLTTKAELTMEEFNQMIPTDLKMKVKGYVKGEIKSAFSLEHIEKQAFEKMNISGNLTLSDFDASYDSLSINTFKSSIKFSMPNKNALKKTNFLYADIVASDFSARKIDSYSSEFKNGHIILETSDIRDSTRTPNISCNFSMDSLKAEMDTINFTMKSADGKVSIFPRPYNINEPQIRLTANTQFMKARIGKEGAEINNFHVNTEIENHKEQKDIFLQWMAKGSLEMEDGKIYMSGISYPFRIPNIDLNFSPETITVKKGKLVIDQSDFELTGKLNNLLSYYRGDSTLRGNLNFNSNITDLFQLMTMTSGIGYEEEKTDTSKSAEESSGPYMVPKGIDISLDAKIKSATFGNDTASNINGKVRVYDGILLIDDVKLSTPAARMQLTAMYKTPRKNHLYLGLDYHMLDVEIEQLLQMIPDIDTLMPMLRSFRGKGEFHLAIETYLDSLYNIKKSTLRGASSISGQNLVLMDGETFSEIAKTLKFNKKTENKVDSLSAEFTIFKDEIDIYPFLIVMDKYKAVVAGRHNFDMSFDYHISVVDCPLPVKLGVDIKGTMDNMKYNLAKCKYAELYRPTSRKTVENKQLELRKMIRDALTQQVGK